MERTVRRLPPEQRRAQLLDAASDLAAGRDLATLSVQDIARHAGVSEGLLYHYFPTKQALLDAAAARAAARMTAALDTVGEDPRQLLVAGLAAYLDHVRDDPVGWRVLLAAHSGEPARIAAAIDARSREVLLRALGVPDPSPALRLVVDGWLAFEKQVCLTWLEQPGASRAAVEDVLVTAFLQALEAAARHDGQARAARDRLLS